MEVGAVVQAAEQPLEQCRLANDHVDEVDAAAIVRIAPAGDLDERRHGVGAVGQEDVLLRREHPEREHGDEKDEPCRQEAGGGEKPHRMSLERAHVVGCALARPPEKI